MLISVFSLVLKKGNVANQREHLILLLANMDIRNTNLQTYTHVSLSVCSPWTINVSKENTLFALFHLLYQSFILSHLIE